MPSQYKNLFKFMSQTELTDSGPLDGITNNAHAAPEVIPTQQFNPEKPTPQLINVIDDFEWTHTPTHGRHEVPRIRLSEYRVEFNSLIQNIRYLLSAAKQTGANVLGQGEAINNISTLTQAAQQKAQKDADKNEKVNFLTRSLDLAKDIGRAINDASINSSNVKANHLMPYHGLYGLQPTGFEYMFPYFDSDWRNVSTNWSSIDGKGGLLGGFITETGNIASDVIDTFGALPQVKGSGIERPQMYSYGEGGASKTLKFSLINTDKFGDVVRNWQLCFMLLYQQLPNKISKVLYEPPVVYEVEIPGLFYSPFAYIRNIAITNRGAIRTMKIPVLYDDAVRQRLNLPTPEKDRQQGDWDSRLDGTEPRNTVSPAAPVRELQKPKEVDGKPVGNTAGSSDPHTEYIETLVPDAYDITINIQSLVPESKNLFFHSTLGPGTKNSGLYDVSLKQGGGTRLTEDWLPRGTPGA